MTQWTLALINSYHTPVAAMAHSGRCATIYLTTLSRPSYGLHNQRSLAQNSFQFALFHEKLPVNDNTRRILVILVSDDLKISYLLRHILST
jgi:hypothetical protein